MVTQSIIRDRIKSRCRELGMSFAEVGERMKKPASQASVSAMLKDDSNPSVHRLGEIAEILGMTISELLSEPASEEHAHKNAVVCPRCGAGLNIGVSLAAEQ